MMPILLLAREPEDLDLEVDEERLDELLAEAPDMIAPCVVAIDRFWKTRRAYGRVPKGGRNAPCPCGSAGSSSSAAAGTDHLPFRTRQPWGRADAYPMRGLATP